MHFGPAGVMVLPETLWADADFFLKKPSRGSQRYSFSLPSQGLHSQKVAINLAHTTM